jgi:DNA polymerase (family 10)
MSNKSIANAFDELARLMELHDEDGFRIRSYRNAYLNLRKLEMPLADMSEAEIKSIKGVGPAIAKKIRQLVTEGKMDTLERYRQETPPGVRDMLEVNGFGPKKVRSVWQDMGIETVGELWYACNENRLVEYKGFGLKTQEDLRKKLEYFLKSRDKLHMDTAEEEADFICTWLTGKLPGAFVAPAGEVRRRCPVVNKIEVLVGYNGELTPAFDGEMLRLEKEISASQFEVRLENQTTAIIHKCLAEEFGSKLFQYSGSEAFVNGFIGMFEGKSFKSLRTEHEVFEKAGLPYVVPELRENPSVLELAKQNALPALVEESDLRGVIHVHSTYSDGLHSLKDMCIEAQNLGYKYIGITDHSQSAFYANGLKPERVLEQMAEIDALNDELAPFKIFKGIESDILNDGSLDYEEEILAKFDFIIASVHSNLRMDKAKATGRVLRAIENPYTTILGHPTGRLLLSREGYALDWDVIMDACAEHKVAIELNANPYRLDLDYTLIPEARKRGIKIAINPDAHSKDGLRDVRYGLLVARKAGLTADGCYNVLGATEAFKK